MIEFLIVAAVASAFYLAMLVIGALAILRHLSRRRRN